MSRAHGLHRRVALVLQTGTLPQGFVDARQTRCVDARKASPPGLHHWSASIAAGFSGPAVTSTVANLPIHPVPRVQDLIDKAVKLLTPKSGAGLCAQLTDIVSRLFLPACSHASPSCQVFGVGLIINLQASDLPGVPWWSSHVSPDTIPMTGPTYSLGIPYPVEQTVLAHSILGHRCICECQI